MIFSIFDKIRSKAKDAKTLTTLCTIAEKYAHQEGEDKPGLEHFVLAAMKLEDGSALRVMNMFDVDSSQLQEAIQKQHEQALNQAGIFEDNIVTEDISDVQTQSVLYQVQPSGQELIKSLHQNNNSRTVPLIGAHVLEAALQFEYGILARALDVLNIDRQQMKERVTNELALNQAA